MPNGFTILSLHQLDFGREAQRDIQEHQKRMDSFRHYSHWNSALVTIAKSCWQNTTASSASSARAPGKHATASSSGCNNCCDCSLTLFKTLTWACTLSRPFKAPSVTLRPTCKLNHSLVRQIGLNFIIIFAFNICKIQKYLIKKCSSASFQSHVETTKAALCEQGIHTPKIAYKWDSSLPYTH